MSTTGKCLCEKVTFTIDEQIDEIAICHCEMCRRWSGSPGFAAHLKGVPTISGEEHMTWYASSEWAERGFCKHCGSNLFYRLLGETPQYFPMIGTFDDQSALTINTQIFIDEKPDYYNFAGDIPSMTGAEVFAMFTDAEKQG